MLLLTYLRIVSRGYSYNLWLVSGYTAFVITGTCVERLVGNRTRQRSGWEANPGPVDHEYIAAI